MATRDLGILKRGREEAERKKHYWQGKQLEPGAAQTTIAYGAEREASASFTVKIIDRCGASIRRSGARGFWSLLADEFLRFNPLGTVNDFYHWLLKQPDASKEERDGTPCRIAIGKQTIKRSSLKDTLSDARLRAKPVAEK
jgi:hypothetical protein